MKHHYLSDKPLVDIQEDRFKRYPFAKRIAETIIKSEVSDCIVIGIYGEWGEGKSTVLNFIEHELVKDGRIAIATFNPWRFKDENTLLGQFFNKLAISISSKQQDTGIKKKGWRLNKKDEPLKNIGENIGDLLEEYTDLLSYIPYGDVVKSGADMVSKKFKPDVDELKVRIEKLLANFDGKIVLFIDDIDRLDKEEIYSIFRLVKLSANFPNTVYILSFDEDMVASAIGTRFGNGDKSAGFSFLEKIIQVPLELPAAAPYALKEFCLRHVDKIIKDNNISLLQEDIDRYSLNFNKAILPRLKTPRLAVRYANSISFILPLLKGEVNIVDLLLIEAVKIFYTPYYNLVRNNSNYFIFSYRTGLINEVDKIKKDGIISHFANISNAFSNSENKSINDLLMSLFPFLSEALSNDKIEKTDSELWLRGKHISSYHYFQRYFSYTVSEGDISDIDFSKFILSTSSSHLDEISYELQNIIQKTTPASFLEKVNSYELPISWESTVNLTKAICINSDFFEPVDTIFNYGINSLQNDSVLLIINLLKISKNDGNVLYLTKELIEISASVEYSYQIFRWLNGFEMEDTELFIKDELVQLGKSLIARSLYAMDGKSIFELPSLYGQGVFTLWHSIDGTSASKYLLKRLENAPIEILTFLKAFTPIARSNHYPGEYYIDFGQRQYNFLKKFLNLDVDFLFQKVAVAFPNEINEKAKFLGEFEKNESNENILRQFIHWYRVDKASIPP
jgi:predicted KAP-like P-loop ATPase